MRNWYRNETRGLEILKEQEVELKTKETKKGDRIEEYRIIIIGAVICYAEDLKIRAMNKLNEIKKIITKIDKLEKEKCLVCISMTERLNGY